jgi:acyl-CoA synthetase (AMP-forming)/AMP-acid ligase II
MTASFAQLLADRAAEAPDRVAVRFPLGAAATSDWASATFAELDQRARAVAAGLRAAGFQRGERAVLLVKPTIDFYPLVFGLFRAGVVPVFIDPGMGRKMALQCVGDIAPAGLIGLTAAHLASFIVRAPFRSITRRVTVGPRLGWSGPTLAGLLATPDDHLPPADVAPDDDCVLVFTSGSTGAPKAVSLTHRCMRERVEQIQALLGLAAGDVISETLLVYTILELCMGLSVVVPPMDLAKPATVDPAAVFRTLDTFQPSLASASPVVWQRFVRTANAQGRRFDHLTLLLTTAAPIPVDLHRRLASVVPASTQLFTPYGATEAMPISLIGTHDVLAYTAEGTARGDGICVGHPAPSIELRVVPVSDEPMLSVPASLPIGQVGELVVRGAGVSAAYRQHPTGNAMAKIADGDTVWHRMGDLGFLDADGRLWFCGRVAHRLHTSRGMVPNVPVEGLFNQHPAVLRSALVGLGPRGAEEAVLCVELEPGHAWSPALAHELIGLARGSRWDGLVSRVVPHPGFPTDTRHNSKIRNEDLRAWLQAQPGSPGQ